MAREAAIEVDGQATERLPGTMFRSELGQDHRVLADTSGKMRKHFIHVLPGDRVSLEMSPYDLKKGRITFCHK